MQERIETKLEDPTKIHLEPMIEIYDEEILEKLKLYTKFWSDR